MTTPTIAPGKPYTGILAEPMPRWSALTAPSDDELDRLIDEKFLALFHHFGLDPGEAFGFGTGKAAVWANLAWHLAREHVPGFRGPPRKRGRPALRKSDDVSLVMRVELLKRRDGRSERAAIAEIAAQNVISGTNSTILTRYKRAKPNFGPLVEMFERMETRLGRQALISALEAAFVGDKKE